MTHPRSTGCGRHSDYQKDATYFATCIIQSAITTGIIQDHHSPTNSDNGKITLSSLAHTLDEVLTKNSNIRFLPSIITSLDRFTKPRENCDARLMIDRLDRDTPGGEIMKALNDVVASGKVRYIGASSMAAWEFQRLQNFTEKHNWQKFISFQGFHNVLYREEREMIPYYKATVIGLLPWSPLAASVLTRPWEDRTEDREESDVFLKVLFRNREEESDKAIVKRVEELAVKRCVSMAQIAAAWVIAQGGMVPICGLGTEKRINNAIEAVNVKLTDEEKRYLEEPYIPGEISGY